MDPRIMIIESDNLFRSLVVERLKKENFRVYTADADCRPDINKILEKNKIDVVIIDLSELKKEGILILETISKAQQLTEVILINSSDQISLSIEGMKLGAYNDFLFPLEIESLLAGIREAVFKKKQQEKKKTLMKNYKNIIVASG
ncbi:MAG: response regulator [Desulfobacterales bacterium]|nr:response regulator [Desulfobacterales bacterium]